MILHYKALHVHALKRRDGRPLIPDACLNSERGGRGAAEVLKVDPPGPDTRAAFEAVLRGNGLQRAVALRRDAAAPPAAGEGGAGVDGGARDMLVERLLSLAAARPPPAAAPPARAGGAGGARPAPGGISSFRWNANKRAGRAGRAEGAGGAAGERGSGDAGESGGDGMAPRASRAGAPPGGGGAAAAGAAAADAEWDVVVADVVDHGGCLRQALAPHPPVLTGHVSSLLHGGCLRQAGCPVLEKKTRHPLAKKKRVVMFVAMRVLWRGALPRRPDAGRRRAKRQLWRQKWRANQKTALARADAGHRAAGAGSAGRDVARAGAVPAQGLGARARAARRHPLLSPRLSRSSLLPTRVSRPPRPRGRGTRAHLTLPRGAGVARAQR